MTCKDKESGKENRASLEDLIRAIAESQQKLTESQQKLTYDQAETQRQLRESQLETQRQFQLISTNLDALVLNRYGENNNHQPHNSEANLNGHIAQHQGEQDTDDKIEQKQVIHPNSDEEVSPISTPETPETPSSCFGWHKVFFTQTDQAKDPELTGEEYFDELVDRSFFQDISMDGVGREFFCKMHDLVHDFTQFLTRDHCYDSYNNEDTFCAKQHRNPIHLSLIYDERDASHGSFLASVRTVDNVRTVQCRRHMDHSFSVDSLSSDLIRNLRNLRVLKLKGMGITHISNQIDKLIHLRYLDLSRNKNLIELPDSLCGLVNQSPPTLQVWKSRKVQNNHLSIQEI
ncbi:hypothetical protein MKX03_024135 [Papaver bracteatum]|nr:hypothetical protein MKX03_024135 [Papaver bracteatum]